MAPLPAPLLLDPRDHRAAIGGGALWSVGKQAMCPGSSEGVATRVRTHDLEDDFSVIDFGLAPIEER
jgi:hypothetical protein